MPKKGTAKREPAKARGETVASAAIRRGAGDGAASVSVPAGRIVVRKSTRTVETTTTETEALEPSAPVAESVTAAAAAPAGSAASWERLKDRTSERLPDKDDAEAVGRWFSAVREALDRLEGDYEISAPISDFFAAVGSGMLHAQRQLDDAGRLYSSVEPAHASEFRIPKVSAELTLELAKTSGKGFNVILASRKDETRQTQTQKVSFDVVSIPAPFTPSERALLADRVFTVLQPGAREVLRRDVASWIAGNGGKPARPAQIVGDEGLFRRVALLKLERGFAIVVPNEGKAPEVFRVATDDAGGVVKVGEDFPAPGDAVNEWLRRVSAVQDKLLSGY